ncbi:MAG: transposase [Rhodobacteraceae bacterium]|nr:transposase [Paracoccaceae bacterium]
MKDLADGHCLEKSIVVVMDTLNTPKRSTLYGTFKPAEASRQARRFAVHHTPKHGSSLNMTAIAINVLTHQCLARFIPDLDFRHVFAETPVK